MRSRRFALGFTQAQLAREASCAVITVRKIEADERRPSESMARSLAGALEVPDPERQRFLAAASAVISPTRLGSAVADLTPVAPGEVPVPLHPLRGRDGEPERIASMLSVQGGPARLVTLTGPPGVGKTRLAVEVALGVASAGSAAVYLADLAPATQPERVAARISTALALAGSPGDPGELLRTKLRREPTLLVVDNAEQVAPAVAGLLEGVLSSCRDVACLVTSRMRLGVYGEHEVPVEPLPVEEAVELFLERARATGGFDGDPEGVPEICGKLDGLPLAIELAAAQVRYLSVGELGGELDRGIGILATETARRDPRHRTMTGAVEWGYSRLGPEAQRALRASSVVTGGLDAQLLADLLDGDLEGSRAVLSELADHQMVRRAGGEWRLFEVVRAVALSRATDFGEIPLFRSRLASHLAGWLTGLAPQVIGFAASSSLDLVEARYEDLLRALSWSFGPEGDRGVGVDLVWGCASYWLTRAIGAPEALDLTNEAVKATGGSDVRALIAAAATRMTVDLDASRTFAMQALSLQPEEYAGEASHMAALTAMMRGDGGEAERHLDAGLARFTEEGKDEGIGTLQMAMGRLSGEGGDLDGFLEHLDLAWEAFARANAPMGLGNVLADRAEVLLEMGRAEEAIEPARRGIQMLLDCDWDWHAASFVCLIAAAQLSLGDPVAAARLVGLQEAWLEDLMSPCHPFAMGVFASVTAGARDALGERFKHEVEEGAALPRTVEAMLTARDA